MPDASVSSLLNSIWSLFARVGITSDLEIVEYLAALLTEDQPSLSTDIRPRMPPDRQGLQLDEIKRLLGEAVTIACDKAGLFDPDIIFRLRDILRGGHYPTPRHIVRFMRRLVQIEEQHHLADFACGTGGFLVTHETNEAQASSVVGVDNSPQWAHLAWANTTLNKTTSASIFNEDPFRLFAQHGSLASQRFERVLMNPPFGATIDADMAKEVLGYETGSNSETALSLLAFDTLTETGCAAILVPTGLLFGRSTGERSLRERLVGVSDEQGHIVGGYQLDAIITLPKDALQPYGQNQTHMLLVHRRSVTEQISLEQHSTWFFQTEKDGYPVGRRRDITKPPPDASDFPFVESILLDLKDSNANVYMFAIDEVPCIEVKTVMSGETFLGVVIETLNKRPFSKVAYFAEYTSNNKEPIPAFFLLEATNSDNTKKLHIRVSIKQGEQLEIVQDVDEYFRTLYEARTIPERERPKRERVLQTLFQDKEQTGAIAIATGDRVLGQAIFAKGIIDRDYELQPKEYVKTVGRKKPVEPSAILLGRIRSSQSTFLDQVDGLLGRLELTPIAGLQLPSKIETGIRPFSRIAKGQEEFWRRICKVSEQRVVTLNGLFTLEDVRGLETQETAQLTLDLFERMGVIVSVTIVNPDKREALPTVLYRRVTERDLWREPESQKDVVTTDNVN